MKFYRKSKVQLAGKAIAFMVLVFCLDFGFGRLLRYYYFRQSSGFLFRRTVALERTTAPFLILGDSRAAHSYVPQTLGSALGLGAYNAGCDGAGMEYHEAVLSVALKRYTPRKIILDLSPTEFDSDQLFKAQIAPLLPYFERHPEIKPILGRHGIIQKIRLLSQVYPFNSNFLSIIMGNLALNKKRREDFDGYVPLEGSWNEPRGRVSQPPEKKLSAYSLESFRNILREAKGRGVSLIVIVAPVFQEWQERPKSIAAALKICREFDVPLWDYSQDPRFVDSGRLFYDEKHLNEEGAKLFSDLLAARLSGKD
jgi:hypothetical protein